MKCIPFGIIDSPRLGCVAMQYIPIPPSVGRYFGSSPFFNILGIQDPPVDQFALAFRSVKFEGAQSNGGMISRLPEPIYIALCSALDRVTWAARASQVRFIKVSS